MTFNSMRETPIYRSQAQLLIEKDAPTVARLDQMFQSQDGWSNDEFYQTQFRILQSRSLAKRTIDAMKLWDAPRLGNGPEPKSRISPTGLVWGVVDGAVALAKAPFSEGRSRRRRRAGNGRAAPRPVRTPRSPRASRSSSAA